MSCCPDGLLQRKGQAFIFMSLVFYGILLILKVRNEDVGFPLPTGANHNYKDFPNVTLMVRTANVPRLKYQFYCLYLRSLTLFWPASYGSLALILDADSQKDHTLGEKLGNQMRRYFPNTTIRIFYENPPKRRSILAERGNGKSASYNRQLWSTFFADRYTSDSILAYMDTDVQFVTPITREYVFGGKRLKVFAESGHGTWVLKWVESTRAALGLHMVANFMITFPQFLYRNTVINCRKYMLMRLNTTHFEDVYERIYVKGGYLSAINIFMTYAWHFEHDRYEWHIKIRDPVKTNMLLPKKHHIQQKHTRPSLIGAAHLSIKKSFRRELMVPGYCMSLKAAGKSVSKCENVTHDLSLLCDYWEYFFRYPWPTADKWCKAGKMEPCCKEAMVKHYKDVTEMAKHKVLTFDKNDVHLVEKMAKEVDVTCENVGFP